MYECISIWSLIIDLLGFYPALLHIVEHLGVKLTLAGYIAKLRPPVVYQKRTEQICKRTDVDLSVFVKGG